MGKKLTEMSLEELWQLFPIFLMEHQPLWKKQFDDEEKNIIAALDGRPIRRISHIGSTAIPGIWAKPIVDILLEVPRETPLQAYADILADNGYLLMSQGKGRISLNKGYTEQGFAEDVFHLHLRYEGDKDELYFRDYLLAHPDIAREYEKLKLSLWKRFEHDRDGYTEAKTDFIRKYTEIAKKEFEGIYS